MSGSPKDFDVINLTETSQFEEFFKTNVNIEGYDPFYSPSNTGVTGIYVKSIYNTVEITDLKLLMLILNPPGLKLKIVRVKILCVAAFIDILVMTWMNF